MLRSPEWQNWLALRYRCLWLHGIPGSGKTVLAAYLFGKINQHCEEDEAGKVASVYYYCFHLRNQNEAGPFLAWVVNQLCRKAELVPENLLRLYTANCQPSIDELLVCLEMVLEVFDRVFIVVDAIDESQPWEDFLRVLGDLATDPRFRKIQLFGTSREYVEIGRAMAPIAKSLSMSNNLVEADIELYVGARIKSTPKFRRWPEQLQQRTQARLSKGAKGMFRWAVCQLDILRRIGHVEDIERALENLPESLDATYERIFTSVAPSDCLLLRHTIHLLCGHGYILNAAFFSSKLIIPAYCSRIGLSSEDSKEILYDLESVKEICGCLVTFTFDEGLGLEGASLAHYTVREFLESDRISNGPSAFFSLRKGDIFFEHYQLVFGQVICGAMDPSLLEPVEDFDTTTKGKFQRDFDTYCFDSTTQLRFTEGKKLAQMDKLLATIFQFFDPFSPHMDKMRAYARFLGGSYYPIFDSTPDILDIKFLSCTGKQDLCTLTNMLWTKCYDIGLKFFQARLEGPDLLLPLTLNIAMRSWRHGAKNFEIRFDGSLLEFLAQASPALIDGSKALRLLYDLSPVVFDPTIILTSLIGSHNHLTCPLGDCNIKWLIGINADPNPTAYQVSPLQIAVARRDYIGTKALLDAGADINASGVESGIRWDEDTIMGRFQSLFGLTPFQILADRKFVLDPDGKLNLDELCVEVGPLYDGTSLYDNDMRVADERIRGLLHSYALQWPVVPS